MITINQQIIGQIPCLTVVNTKKVNDALPTLIYFHGFTSAKEHNLPIAFLLAKNGYRVILPDSKWHGDRRGKISEEERKLTFWYIILENIKELGQIHEELQQKDLIAKERFGVAGTSMGGITTSAALTAYPWIDAGAIFMGTPAITRFANYLMEGLKQQGNLPIGEDNLAELMQQLEVFDLAKQPEKINDRPIFFWHGEDDSVIPFQYAYTFYKELISSKHTGPVKFMKEANRDHKVSRYAIIKGVEWLKKYL